jgi:predicted ATPase
MFKSLQIRHFKSIERADIELGYINIFVGNNGSGKSNIVDAVRFLKEMASNGLDRAVSDRHGIESVRQWSPTRPYIIMLGATVERGEFRGEYEVAVESAKGLFQVVRETAILEDVDDFAYELQGQETETRTYQHVKLSRDKAGDVSIVRNSLNLNADEERPDSYSVTWDPRTTHAQNTYRLEANDEVMMNQRPAFGDVMPLRRTLSDFQAYSIYPNTLRSPQEPSSDTFLSPEGRNLGSVIKRMRKTKRGVDALGLVTEALKSIHPNLERISILSVGGYLVPQFHMLEPSGKRHIFNVSQMSDGTLRVLGLLVALYQEPRPAVIALEEPEQTVNPAILSVIADAIKEVSKRSQILVTTHSPHLLDQFDPADIRSVELQEGKTIVGPVNPIQIGAVRDRLFSLGELLVSEGLHS